MLIKKHPVVEKAKKYYICECTKCHELTTHRIDHLKKGEARCVCEKNKTNHEYGTRLYQTWRNMINRCERGDSKSYKSYGGRGIKVCDEWRNNYIAFSTWAKTNGYKDNLTIERIDVSKGYSPENCCWITRQQQAQNKRNSSFLYLSGEKKTVAEWSRVLGIPCSTIRNRIYNGKLKGEEILTTPIKYKLKIKGE